MKTPKIKRARLFVFFAMPAISRGSSHVLYGPLLFLVSTKFFYPIVVMVAMDEGSRERKALGQNTNNVP